MKKKFCCPALDLFHCLPQWKTELFVSSRAFSLSTPTFLLSTSVENSEATWKKPTKIITLFYTNSILENKNYRLGKLFEYFELLYNDFKNKWGKVAKEDII